MPAKQPIQLRRLMKNRHFSLLQQLQYQAQQSDRLTDILHEVIPFSMHEHCRVGILKEKVLVIIAQSPAWATRLRYLTPQIIQHLKKSKHFGISKIQVKIRPQHQERSQPTRKANVLSKENADLLRKTANGIQDTELAQAFIRLSKMGSE